MSAPRKTAPAAAAGIQVSGIEINGTDEMEAFVEEFRLQVTAVAAALELQAAKLTIAIAHQLRKDIPGIDGNGGRMSQVAALFGGQGADKTASAVTDPMYTAADNLNESVQAIILAGKRWATNVSEPIHAAKNVARDADMLKI